MNKPKMLIIGILIIIVLVGFFYVPKHKGKEIKSNELCVLIGDNDVIYVACSIDNKWFKSYQYINSKWRVLDKEEIEISKYRYLSGEDIKSKKINNLFIGEGGSVYHEPLKRLINDKNRFKFSVGIGLETDLSDSVVLRIYKKFREYTYRYELRNGEIFFVASHYNIMVY